MKFNPAHFSLQPNDYVANQKKIDELRIYCEKLPLTHAKRIVLSHLFIYAEKALCKAPENQSTTIDNILYAAIQEAMKKLVYVLFKKQPKPTDPARFESYNSILNTITSSDLDFLDTVLRQIGETQTFISSKFSPNGAVSMMFSRGSRFASIVAPEASKQRSLILTDESRLLKQAGMGFIAASSLLFFQLLNDSLILQFTIGRHLANQRPDETMFDVVLDNLLHACIHNSLLIMQLGLVMLSACGLLFSKEIVGAIKPVRSVATFFAGSAHTAGKVDEDKLPELQLSASSGSC